MIKSRAEIVHKLHEYVGIVEQVVCEQKLATMSTDAVVAIAASLYQTEVFQEIADSLAKLRGES